MDILLWGGFFSLLVNLAIAIFVITKDRKNKVNIAFGILGISIGAWSVGSFVGNVISSPPLVLFSIRICHIFAFFVPSLSYYFCALLTDTVQKRSGIIRGFYLFSFFLLPFVLSPLFIKNVERYGRYMTSVPGPIHHVFMIFFVIVFIMFFVEILMGIKHAKVELRKKQLKVFTVAAVIGVLAGVIYFSGVLRIIPDIYITDDYFLVAYFLLTAYGIVRYRLMEIDTVVHKTLLWMSALLLLVLPAALIELLLLVVFLKKLSTQTAFLINLIFISIYLIFFVSYYTRLRPRIDHIFRRRKYDYQTILGKVAEKIATTIDIESLTQQLLIEICETMYLRNSIFYILAKDEKEYYLIARRGYREVSGVRQRTFLEIYNDEERENMPPQQRELRCDTALCKWIMEYRDVLEREQLELESAFEKMKQEALTWFKAQEVELIVPLVLENKVHAILGLGKKENLGGYTLKDIELLRKLGQEAGVTVFNALHYEDLVEKERLDEEMRMGRQIQMALLPQESPRIAGFKVEGFMHPAKEIGGDYYDFITLPRKDELAIIIGDVSGKGVAAGLFMAMAKTAIHTLSQEESSPKRILLRANQILHQHISGQKFMTMLYLIWQSKSQTITYSSAGHEHILIYRERNATLEAIRSGGLMLGMLPEIENYLEENQIQLHTGDKVLLYTDGVTEAQNRGGERFSLERLKITFLKNSQKTASQIMRAVEQEVHSFIGNYPQYDDITLVVMEIV